jgi:hypothetical protein
MDRYYFFARLLPAAITAVPFITLWLYTAGSQLTKALGTVWGASAKFFQVAPSVGIIFLMVQLVRFVSKELFQRLYFQDDLNMPTTRYLSIPSSEEEEQDEGQARKQIAVCVGQIRNRLRGNNFLLRHNIEFGFFRNLLGGCAVSFLVSLGVLYFFRYVDPNPIAFWLTAFFGLAYALLLLVSKFVLNRFGHYYAAVLYEQYLSS